MPLQNNIQMLQKLFFGFGVQPYDIKKLQNILIIAIIKMLLKESTTIAGNYFSNIK
ncbi:hypothetical protein [Desulfitobacterium hafniense]|uniref:hypothetical protein n=1 Tax=Desulfitobacterium hafniense TaxID=49338 RepID=UPI000A46187E|nr:hypothetical protein [Desulfitobacterium hafniense]